jgi:hypothetical protein
MLEGRDALERWGFTIPTGDSVHVFVRWRFLYASDRDLKAVGVALDNLVQLRSKADYKLHAPDFATNTSAVDAINRAASALPLLDGVAQDPVRRAAATADIRARWP